MYASMLDGSFLSLVSPIYVTLLVSSIFEVQFDLCNQIYFLHNYKNYVCMYICFLMDLISTYKLIISSFKLIYKPSFFYLEWGEYLIIALQCLNYHLEWMHFSPFFFPSNFSFFKSQWRLLLVVLFLSSTFLSFNM